MRLHIRSTAMPNSSFLLMMTTILSIIECFNGADMTTDYLKPTVSSKACVETVEVIAAKTESLGNDGACMQCDPANAVCPPGCQALVDDLYVNCDGVATPGGLYYDPDNLIEGEWSGGVKAAIKIATERCGCDRTAPTTPPWAGVAVGTVGMTLLHAGLMTLSFLWN